jgi:hypothetical protein
MAVVLYIPTISTIGLYMGSIAILQSVNSDQLHTGLLPMRSLLLYRLASFDPNPRQGDKSRTRRIHWFQAELHTVVYLISYRYAERSNGTCMYSTILTLQDPNVCSGNKLQRPLVKVPVIVRVYDTRYLLNLNILEEGSQDVLS